MISKNLYFSFALKATDVVASFTGMLTSAKVDVSEG